jgi:hypothetical protein
MEFNNPNLWELNSPLSIFGGNSKWKVGTQFANLSAACSMFLLARVSASGAMGNGRALNCRLMRADSN